MSKWVSRKAIGADDVITKDGRCMQVREIDRSGHFHFAHGVDPVTRERVKAILLAPGDKVKREDPTA